MASDNAARPIGVFDSGIGGLSILQALRVHMPTEDFVYIADSGHAPYGERDAAHIEARSRAITAYLLAHHHIKALVVACNTATAGAIDRLRSEHPGLPIVGVEPALKPAAVTTRTQRIGVLATRGTLASARFASLLASIQGDAEFICQPCDGLAEAIEHSAGQENATNLIAMCARYTRAIGQFGLKEGQVDTLVLGCTHYPLAQAHLRQLVGPDVSILSTGEPVARQTLRLLQALPGEAAEGTGQVTLAATGRADLLGLAATKWLGWSGVVSCLALPH